MSKKEFFHSTMKEVDYRIDSYQKKREENTKLVEYQAWLTGMYVIHSIACNFSKKARYPQNPIVVDTKDIKQVAKATGRSEEELRQEEMYMTLRIKQANANIAQARQDREESQGG